MSGYLHSGRIEHGLWATPEVFGHAPQAGACPAPGMAAPVNDAASSQEPSMALLEAARRGEEAAGKEIVTLLHPLVARLVSRQIRRNADLEDVLQEVFIKVFVKMHQYRGPQPFSHWVSRLAVTTCYDWLRRQKARPAVMASDLTDAERIALEHIQSQAEDHGGNDDPDLVSGLLDRLIAALKPHEQIVIRLLDLEERSVAEISALTGWGQSKVKVTAFRARKKLNTLLKQLESP
ncbi:RNA polymerase sigma factor [Luteolibacter soli]|uniref:RNA polymerase sigma factor n=1 Tax=Luteolibacter soli TaxID=3135280 RepID=A0ABU9B0C9_9BACT